MLKQREKIILINDAFHMEQQDFDEHTMMVLMCTLDSYPPKKREAVANFYKDYFSSNHTEAVRNLGGRIYLEICQRTQIKPLTKVQKIKGFINNLRKDITKWITKNK